MTDSANATIPKQYADQYAERRERNIALLKEIRQATLDLRVLCNGYSLELSGEFLKPLAAVDRNLAYALLAREMAPQAPSHSNGAAWADLQSETEAIDGDQVL